MPIQPKQQPPYYQASQGSKFTINHNQIINLIAQPAPLLQSLERTNYIYTFLQFTITNYHQVAYTNISANAELYIGNLSGGNNFSLILAETSNNSVTRLMSTTQRTAIIPSTPFYQNIATTPNFQEAIYLYLFNTGELTAGNANNKLIITINYQILKIS